MPSEQIRDVLKHVRDVHHRLSDFYEDCCEEQPDERMQLLLDYMGRHEKNIERCLRKYESGAAEGVLNTWVKFAPEESLRDALSGFDLQPGLTADEVVAKALTLDRALVDLYRQLASETSASRVQELFNSLLQLEEGKEHQYAKTILGLQDD